MQFIKNLSVGCLLSLILIACSTETNYAPVTDLSYMESIPKTGSHRVTSGETLYSIAWRYGLDYRYLAKRNTIAIPYAIYPGELIYLRGQTNQRLDKSTNIYAKPELTHVRVATKAVPVQKPLKTSQTLLADDNVEPNYSFSKWNWPAKGRVIKLFSATNKGINIAGDAGEPIFAAGSGKVVYAGNGLRGYGNLIIIKHNSLYLSAYAHNRRLLVREGMWVTKGQKIAEMGNTGTDRVMLHFEIRKGGLPIDPTSFYHKI